MLRMAFFSAVLVMAVACSTTASGERAPGYQTLEGMMSLQGTGTINYILFRSEAGDMYEIVGPQKTNLDRLRGLKVTLTGSLTLVPGLNTTGRFDVRLYNVDFKDAEGRDVILGQLEQEGDRLILLTRDQRVISIDPSSPHHGLARHAGKEVVIRGRLANKRGHNAEIAVASYILVR
jgi:hypothetical protein